MNFEALIWREPWLAPVILNLKSVVKTREIQAAAVTPDGRTLYYNPEFWKHLTPEERLGVQLHEIMHIVCLHAKRRENREHSKWNIACDMAINYQICSAGYVLLHGALPGEDDTAENIYERLQKASLRANGKEQNSPYDSDCDYEYGDGDSAMSGDLLMQNTDGSGSCCSDETMAAIESSGHLAAMGTTPLSQSFRPAKPKADWRTALRSLVRSVAGDEMDYLTYEFDEFGICEDFLSAKPRCKICVLVDESGSISDDLYEQFLGELFRMSRFAEIYVSGFAGGTELNAVPLSKYERTMTGGTDVIPAYEQVCKEDFDCIVVLTDGHLEFPEFEPKHTIWAMPESFGRRMEVII